MVFELVLRTCVSTWTVHQMPESSNMFDFPAHFERNELMAYSHRPDKLSICPKQKFSHDRLHNGLGRVLNKIAATLFAFDRSPSSPPEAFLARRILVEKSAPTKDEETLSGDAW